MLPGSKEPRRICRPPTKLNWPLPLVCSYQSILQRLRSITIHVHSRSISIALVHAIVPRPAVSSPTSQTVPSEQAGTSWFTDCGCEGAVPTLCDMTSYRNLHQSSARSEPLCLSYDRLGWWQYCFRLRRTLSQNGGIAQTLFANSLFQQRPDVTRHALPPEL